MCILFLPYSFVSCPPLVSLPAAAKTWIAAVSCMQMMNPILSLQSSRIRPLPYSFALPLSRLHFPCMRLCLKGKQRLSGEKGLEGRSKGGRVRRRHESRNRGGRRAETKRARDGGRVEREGHAESTRTLRSFSEIWNMFLCDLYKITQTGERSSRGTRSEGYVRGQRGSVLWRI